MTMSRVHMFRPFSNENQDQCNEPYCRQPLDDPIHLNAKSFQYGSCVCCKDRLAVVERKDRYGDWCRGCVVSNCDSDQPCKKGTVIMNAANTKLQTISQDDFENTWAPKLTHFYGELEATRLHVTGTLPDDALANTVFDPAHRALEVEDYDGDKRVHGLTALYIENDETVGVDATGSIGLIAATVVKAADIHTGLNFVADGAGSSMPIYDEVEKIVELCRKNGLSIQGEVRFKESGQTVPSRILVDDTGNLKVEKATLMWPTGEAI